MCPSCGTLISIKQNYRIGNIKIPKRCSCGRANGFLQHSKKEINTCFVQLEDLQENTDNPHSQRIKGVLFDSLCKKDIINLFTPGNEVKCLGILKEVPIFKNGKETIFLNWIFEIINVELIEKEIEIDKLEDDEIEEINILSNNIDKEGLNYLTESFAPEVYGYGNRCDTLRLCG